MASCRLVVAGPVDRALRTVVATMRDHGYRVTREGRGGPLTLQRGSVAGYALLRMARAADLALYSVVVVRPTVLPSGDVHLAMVQTRAHTHEAGTPVMRAAVGDLARRFAAQRALRFAGPLAPAALGTHLHVDHEGAAGYRGELGADGAPLAWLP
jgi:hypothetical protein